MSVRNLPKYPGVLGRWSSGIMEASASVSNKHPIGSNGCPTQPSTLATFVTGHEFEPKNKIIIINEYILKLETF